MKIEGKTVLITGGSEGIGAACAEAFRSRGANISLVARSEDKLREVGGSDAVITAGDLTGEAVRRRSIEATLERFSSLDILINNAGIGLYAPTWEAPMEDVRRMVELNLFVPLQMIQLAVPHLAKQGGAIVNVGSIAGKVTLPWLTLYSMTKYGLGSMTDGLRMELKEMGIHTINVCPGYVKTRFQEHVLTGRVPPSIERSKKFAITAEQCAEAIAKGVERDSRTVMAPGAGWMLVVLERLFPSIVDWQLHRLYRSLK